MKETRVHNETVKLRNEESRLVGGYALRYNSDSRQMGFFIERIAPTALDGVDLANSDIVSLFNHDYNLPLARTPDSLKLIRDNEGLYYEFNAPGTTAGNDLIENLRANLVRHSSFAFTIESEEWSYDEKGEMDVRTITKFRQIYDVSPVTNPAYYSTSVGLREFAEKNEAYREYKKEKEGSNWNPSQIYTYKKRLITL